MRKALEPSENPSPIRVVIADDHPVILEGLRSLFHVPDIEIVGESETGWKTLQLLQEIQPDLLVLDIGFSDMDSMEMLRIIRETRKDLPVLVFTQFNEEKYYREARHFGAKGFLCKAEAPSSLLEAVRLIGRGGSLPVSRWSLPSSVKKRRRLVKSNEDPSPEPQLGKRQEEILSLTARGFGPDQIAEITNLAVSTVNTHTHNIYRKIGVKNRTEAVLWAIRNGLGPPGKDIA